MGILYNRLNIQYNIQIWTRCVFYLWQTESDSARDYGVVGFCSEHKLVSWRSLHSHMSVERGLERLMDICSIYIGNKMTSIEYHIYNCFFSHNSYSANDFLE